MPSLSISSMNRLGDTYQLRIGEIGNRVHSKNDDEASDGDGGYSRDDPCRVGREDPAVTDSRNRDKIIRFRHCYCCCDCKSKHYYYYNC